MSQECGECRWWVPFTTNGKQTGKGDCHRYPPRTVCEVWSERDEYDGKVASVKSSLDDYRPTTDHYDFCGEWMKRNYGKER